MNSASHHREIEAKLDRVRVRIRKAQRSRGAMVVATIALGGLLLIMGVDLLFAPLPAVARWMMTALWLLATAYAVKKGFGPMFRPIGHLQLARWLEMRHPEMEERLSTVLELTGHHEGISPQLLESLARAAEADVTTVDANLEVKKARTGRKWARPAAVLGAVMLLCFIIWPGPSARLFVRAVAPFADTGSASAGKFNVKPGDIEVLAGDPVKIAVNYTGKQRQLEVRMELADGRKISQAMTKTGEGHVYILDPAKAGFRYHIGAGREESDAYTVTVLPLPGLLEPRVTLKFPEYTERPPREMSLENGITALVGTRVTLTGKTVGNIGEAWVEINGSKPAGGTVERSPDGSGLEFTWKLLRKDTEVVVKLRHPKGREVEAIRFPVNVLEDLHPEVVLLSPMQRELKLRPDEMLPLKYEITEDFSVAAVSVEVEANGSLTDSISADLPPREGQSGPAVYRGEAVVPVGALLSKNKGARELRVRVRAEDHHPSDEGGPGTGFSEWVTLRIDQGAESLARQELREEHDGARRKIEDALRATREGRERMDWHRGEIKNARLNDNAAKDLKESGERLAKAEEILNELGKRMQESVHATKADDLQKAAELVTKAREELENSRLRDEPSQRESTLVRARDNAEKAERQLEQIRDAMEQDRQKIEDLARLMDMAQRQQELARQAEENLETAKLPDDWKNQQRQMEQQIQQQLRERPDAKARALTAQAEQAKALAGEAHEMSQAQQGLVQQAKETSAGKLQKALAEEQAAIAREANEQLAAAREARNDLADTLPEATAAAQQAKDQIEKGAMADAMTSATEAARAMEDSARQTPGDKNDSNAEPATRLEQAAQGEALSNLAERQKQVAGALDELAKGNTAEAMKKLQAARAEAAGTLADEIATMPQVDGNGSMQEAANNSRQGGQRAEEAAKKGREGKMGESAQQHGESGGNFAKAAESLERAAGEFARQAQQAAGQQPDTRRAQPSPAEMARAFQQASQAASGSSPAEAASSASQAAQALAQAAQAGRQQMQGKGHMPSGTPGGPAGNRPQQGPRPLEADPGIPPELAKLGISSGDWAKIRSSLKSDVGAGEGAAIPEEYRELVKGYFESMSRNSGK